MAKLAYMGSFPKFREQVNSITQRTGISLEVLMQKSLGEVLGLMRLLEVAKYS